MEVQYYAHTCLCGCGEQIEIKKSHKWYGIPKYKKGHNKSTLDQKRTEEQNKRNSEAHKGYIIKEETKQKLRIKSTGKKHTEDTKNKISLKNKGKKRNAEQRQNMSKGNRGKKRKPLSIFTIEKIRKSNQGKKRTDEQRQKMSKVRIGHVVLEKTKQLLSDINKLENHPQWQGGKSFEPYSPEFNRELKKLIKERDQYICQNLDCEYKINVLVVHHIDYDKKNNDLKNLIALCNSCNIKANFNRQYWLKFYQNIMGNRNEICNNNNEF